MEKIRAFPLPGNGTYDVCVMDGICCDRRGDRSGTGGRRHGLRRSSFGSNGYFTECSSADGGSAGRSAL